MILETERLVLRPVEESDAALLFPLINDAGVAANMLSVPHPYPEDGYVPWIREAHRAMERREAYHMTIVLKETGLPFGAIGITDIRWDHMRGEIGYWLGQPYWGRGYATEAAKRMLAFGFDDLGLERIHAYCLTRNEASARVLEKACLTLEGRIRHAVKKGDTFHDVFLYGIIREEFVRAHD